MPSGLGPAAAAGEEETGVWARMVMAHAKKRKKREDEHMMNLGKW
jgi:hypothetical protein